jgi:acyl-CoA-binding protein
MDAPSWSAGGARRTVLAACGLALALALAGAGYVALRGSDSGGAGGAGPGRREERGQGARQGQEAEQHRESGVLGAAQHDGSADLDTDTGSEDESEERFERAQAFASSGGLGRGVSDDAKLKLYGLFKQASSGDCAVPRPSVIEFVALAKWKSWRELQGMPRARARRMYAEQVDALAPGWNRLRERELAAMRAEAEVEASKGGKSMAPAVSTLAAVPDKPESELTAGEVLLELAAGGDAAALVAALGSQHPDAVCGEGRETLLHMACDRGCEASARALVGRGASVEARDVDGMTPLAYALMSDHDDLARVLVAELGADPGAVDESGQSVLEVSGDDELKAQLKAIYRERRAAAVVAPPPASLSSSS